MKFAFPTILIVTAVGIFFWFTNPLMTEIDVLKAQVASYDEALGNSRKLIATREKLLQRRNSFPQENLEKIQKMLPDSIDNVRLIIDMQSIGDKYNMNLRNVRITSQGSKNAKDAIGPDSKKYDALGLAFTVTGTYDTFKKFLGDLEKSLRLMDISTVTFTSVDREAYDYSVEIKTYWLK